MDTEEELDVIDILAYNSGRLLEECANVKDDAEQALIIEAYLRKHSESKMKCISDFQKDLDWFNVTEPISMGELKGKLVVLDFFTYCCINCMHILPDLKAIESAYPVESGLVVIGVHSAKFDNEKDSANLLSAIQRYKITHPIVNDFSSDMWAQLKIKCWPTLFFISPTGVPLFVLMGEGHGDLLNKFVAKAISFYEARNQLNDSPLPLNPSTDLICASNLRFPSKMCCRLPSGQMHELIAVSDSGNNRILVLNSEGHVLEKIGGFESGFKDGDFRTARFNSPQGLTFLDDDVLIVADTGNHSIRRLNLKEKHVSTIAGTGKQGNDKIGGLPGSKQELSSPWDVALLKTRDMDMSFHMDEKSIPEKNVILIAMAGTHQIWGIFLDGIIWWKFKKYEPQSCAAIIGNGLEENRNNSYPQNAAFAQPSGIALVSDMLLIADSESSSIRKASMIDGKVTAVVGGDRNPLNLFAFGDTDGKQFSAKLQHPLGLTHNPIDGYLYVADTYNHKIKRVDITSSVIETCLIREKDNPELFQFSEPDGLCVDSKGKYLYVADTNNHTIQVVNLESMLTWPLPLKFNIQSNNEVKGHLLKTLEKRIQVNKKSRLVINASLTCENGVKLTENAPQKWNLHLPFENYSAEQMSGRIHDGKFSVIVNANGNDAPEQSMQLNCSLSICSGSVCMHREFRTLLVLTYDTESPMNAVENLKYTLKVDDVDFL